MSKIKELFAVKRNVIIVIAVACVVVAIAIALIVITGNQPTPVEIVPANVQSSSTPSSKVSSIVVPEIVVDKPVSSASPSSEASSASASSKEPDLKVEGNPSSKAVSSAPTVKVDSKPQSSKPAESKPVVSSQPTVEPLPPPVVEPIDPPINPDGPQHGDTKTQDDGSTWYFHVGANGYESQQMWDLWGKFPQAKRIPDNDGYDKFDGSFLREGETIWVGFKNSNARWCKVQDFWIAETAYNLNSHTGNDHGQNH